MSIKGTFKFFSDYRHFGIICVAILVSLGLDIYGADSKAHFLLGISALASAIPLLKDIINDLREGTYGVDILAVTAIITSVLLGEYWAGIIIVLMLTGGEALEDYAERRAKTELTSLLKNAPKYAHLIKGRKTTEVKVNEVKIGNKVLIKPGEVVPVDGIITDGVSNVDESSITGESLPISKRTGNTLLSGSVNMEAPLTIQAIHDAKNSQYEQIVKLVRSAAASKAPFVRLADRYSIPFTIISFAIAFSAWAISGEVIRFLQVLVVATPCPLILAAPIALISGMSRSAKQGVIIKTGGSLEALASVKTVGFDKTGTLTEGLPKVSSIKSFNKTTDKEVISLAAALEHKSNHVLAKAITDEAKSKKVNPARVSSIKEIPGYGLSGKYKGQDIFVGKPLYARENGFEFPPSLGIKKSSSTASIIAIDKKIVGLISFSDKIRPEAKNTLKNLKNLGIQHLLMVTGDNQTTADKIAKDIGLTDVSAECLPADKLKVVEQVKHKPVAFVGDGVNDAPVLAASDVGIALGARGSTAASESADVVIMLDDLEKVSSSIAIAKRTLGIAKQSIFIGIAISIGLMFVFSTGKFAPVYGAAIQEVVDVIVIFNALRAHLN